MIQLTFGLIIVGFIGFSIYLSRRVKTVSSYYVADRSLAWPWIAGAMVATWLSAGTILGVPGMHYQFGIAPMALWTGGILAAGFGFVFISPYLRRANVRTVPDFLGKRFNSKLASAIAGIFVLLAFYFYMAGSVVGLGTILSNTFGISYTLALTIGLGAMVVVSAFGGVVSVTKTDFMASAIGIIGLVAVLISILYHVGGFGDLVQKTIQVDPNWFSWNDAGSYPVLATILVWVGRSLGAVDIHTRFFGAKSEKDLYLGLMVGVIVLALFTFSISFIGAGAKVLVPGIENPDDTFIILATNYLPGWLTGIALGTVALLAVSTMNAQLLISGQAVANDIIGNLMPNLKQNTILSITRISTIIIGFALFLIGILQPALILHLLTIGAAIIAYAFVFPVVLGIWWNKGNAAAFIVSSCTGLLFQVMTVMNIISIPIDPLLIGIPIVAVLYVSLSLLFPASKEGINFRKSMFIENNHGLILENEKSIN